MRKPVLITMALAALVAAGGIAVIRPQEERTAVEGTAAPSVSKPAECPVFPAGVLPSSEVLQAFVAGCEGLEEILASPDGAAKVAWSWFIWLNEPLAGGRKVRRWEELFQQDTLVYLPPDPTSRQVPAPAWNPSSPPPQEVLRAAQEQGLDISRPFHQLAYEQQSDGKVLSDKFRYNIRYQVLLNQAAFEYLVSRKLYSRDGQIATAKEIKAGGRRIDFPRDAWELKASWLWIPKEAPAEKYGNFESQYYMVNAWWSHPEASPHMKPKISRKKGISLTS